MTQTTTEKTGLEFMVDLFDATRDHTKFTSIIVPPELKPYAQQLYAMYEQDTAMVIPAGLLRKEKKPISNTAFFTISGGKDLLATYLRNRDRFEDKRCFHVQGITMYVGNAEHEGAKRIAKKLGFAIESLDLHFDAKTSLAESVIKNQMIYALVMERQKIVPTAIGFGGTQELGPQSMCFYHDSNDSFTKFHDFAQQAWGPHELIPFVKDEIDAFKAIYDNAKEVVDLISSCMTPVTTKENVRRNIENRFGIKLTNKYQCGGCYKCAEEQIIAKEYFQRKLPASYEQFCKTILVDKCVFETHNMNGLVPHTYLTKLGIKLSSRAATYINCSIDQHRMEETIFHKIARGESPCHKIWEDENHLAFLSIYPNTEGVTVVIPKQYAPSYFADCDDQVVVDLIIAAKKVAKILNKAFPDCARTGLVFEGYGVDYLHVKLFPMHGTTHTTTWQPIRSNIKTYFDKYTGYISSHDSERADDEALADLAKRIRE